MIEELIKNQNKNELVLIQFQFIQIFSDTNKDVDVIINILIYIIKRRLGSLLTKLPMKKKFLIIVNCKFKVIGESIYCLK